MSSGSLTADRRFAYAQSLADEGDLAGGIEVMEQVLEIAPAWPEGRFALAEMLQAASRQDEASTAYRAYLAVAPEDSMGAEARLALLGSGTPDRLPEAYVRRLFEQYAPRFEHALVEKLAYRAPALLREAITAAAPGRRFARTYDLGCGTGLAGVALRDLTAWLGGVDLSPAMVRRAEQKHIYDFLGAGDMIAALGALEAPCDLVVAADVLVYCGDLAPVFAAVRAALADDGLYVFTVQRLESGTYALGPEQRFSHHPDYVRDCARLAGMGIVTLVEAVTRKEKGVDVPSLVVAAGPQD